MILSDPCQILFKAVQPLVVTQGGKPSAYNEGGIMVSCNIIFIRPGGGNQPKAIEWGERATDNQSWPEAITYPFFGE